jgi:hypothetical protein
MELKQEQPCRKKKGKECSFAFKTPSGLAAGGLSTTFARESSKLSFRSDFSREVKPTCAKPPRYTPAFQSVEISLRARYFQ